MLDDDSHIPVDRGSERQFGLVVGGILAMLGALPAAFGDPVRWWLIVPGTALVALALVRPALLAPLNALWFRLGLLLGAVVAPVVMALVYLLTVVPIGLAMRLMGKDLLGTRLEPERESYWISRTEPVQPMRKQY